MQELALVPPDGEVRDDVEPAVRVAEGLLEQLVEARRDHELMRHAARGERPFEQGEPRMHPAGRAVAVEQLMELVVERANPLRQRDVLRAPRQVASVLGRALERAGEMGDELLGRREAVLPVLARPVDTRSSAA